MVAYNPLDQQWEEVVIDAPQGRAARGPLSRGALPTERAQWLISPGFWDVQINGIGRVDFNAADLTVADVRQAVDQLLSEGVVRFCPTLITASADHLQRNLTILRRAWESDPRVDQALLGIHLEGPYLSAQDGPRGAHAPEWIRDPQWEEFSRWQTVAGSRIRLITVAPERRGMVDFIRRATASGVLVAIGHHAASTEQIARAVEAGARLTTHFGNGAHAELPRHPNYLWDQLAHRGLALSVIGDGVHLPPSVLQVVFRAKPGQVLLISDRLADPIRSAVGTTAIGQSVTVEADRVGLAGSPGLLAGAVTPMPVALARTARVVGNLEVVLAAVTQAPARLLGLDAADLARDWVVFRSTEETLEVGWVVRDDEILYTGRHEALSV